MFRSDRLSRQRKLSEPFESRRASISPMVLSEGGLKDQSVWRED
jgi:hypothetical protein